MDIHRDLIKAYIRKLTLGRGSAAPDPFADITLFQNDVQTMKSAAERAGDLEWLRLSMDALIANPDGRIDQFVGQGYPFSDEEMVALLTYAYTTIWPDHEISEPGYEAPLDFVDMTDETWESIRNPSESEDLF